ncbi:MAG: hypothetical protein G3M78_10460 [Candidatus Nitrohelix vancouverensis]|uniref:Uncharacterized protein n=1 Tax=Candidatus Nitrohelix vancouverensis TaxID=2705534 RepID=A0A7T0C3E5_9BACT|nr:MAG: hypothetical protein G3M78_10460 [Candidatus Nitrohelix vancouverensis]
MKENPEEEPTLLNGERETHLCLNCGFPNRNSDKVCMYCRASLVEDTGLISWARNTYLVLKWRWELKQKRQGLQSATRRSLLAVMGYSTAGILLAGGGFLLLRDALSENSFANGLISIVFLLYGVFVLKSLFTKK